MFEFEVLMRKFSSNTEKVRRGWRTLHNEELKTCPLSRYHYNDQIEGNKMECTCSTHKEMSSSDKTRLKGCYHLGDLHLDKRKILKQALEENDV
jgi:hypothetical protein